MQSKYHIVVSAENNCYMAWQSKLFHYSCLTHLGLRPVIMVHELEPEWHRGFIDIVAAGGIVRRAPSFRTTPSGFDYSPRNTAGTLMQAAQMGYRQSDFIVIFDPDMIFLRRLIFPRSFASERCFSLNYENPQVRAAARRFGISETDLRRKRTRIECSVPHVIPVWLARPLAETWLEAIDCFRPGRWEISMYAFGLAVLKLKLELAFTRMVALNDERHERVGRAAIIHYAYGNECWNKRNYWDQAGASAVWTPTVNPPKGTVLAEVISQINKAREFYSRQSHAEEAGCSVVGARLA